MNEKLTQNGIEITDHISAEDYLEMRTAVGWSVFPLEQAADGLKHTAHICCLRKDGKPVAIGRMLWDHGYTAYVSDVIVKPEFQAQGLGRIVMDDLMGYIKSVMKPGYRIMVSLKAAKGKEGFYKKFGFIERPNENFGAGMHVWLEN